jgi:hypothetical protein
LAELIVVADSDLQPASLRESNQLLRVGRVDREWFFHIYMASRFQALCGQWGMTFGRRGDVDHIGFGNREQLSEFAKALFDGEPLMKLARHERLSIAYSDDFAVLDS